MAAFVRKNWRREADGMKSCVGQPMKIGVFRAFREAFLNIAIYVVFLAVAVLYGSFFVSSALFMRRYYLR